MKRTYVRLMDGYFTGGNMALLRPEWFARCRDRLDLFVAYRKKPDVYKRQTLDLKEIEGEPIAKRGRIPGLTENPRLVKMT